MIKAIRKAVRTRIAGITGNKRRGYYGQVAEMVAACAKIDPVDESKRWAAAICNEYRRYPALIRELNERL